MRGFKNNKPQNNVIDVNVKIDLNESPFLQFYSLNRMQSSFAVQKYITLYKQFFESKKAEILRFTNPRLGLLRLVVA